MVRTCMREGRRFGVLLIREGAEVGTVGAMAEVGTAARIFDFDAMPDGLLKIVARGEQRFRIITREQQADGLHLGDVQWLADSPATPLAEGEYPELRNVLAQALEALGSDYPCGEAQPEDALWVGSQLAQLLPVPAELRQRLLEIDDARQRLDLLDAVRAGPDA
jgi:Lon protease-like protein